MSVMAGSIYTSGWRPPADENIVLVRTGELAMADHPEVLVTPALGSCVGVVLWDAFARRGGMAHIMLPHPSEFHLQTRGDRFASVAMPKLAKALSSGAARHRLVAKIAGGATMFGEDSGLANIGIRNVEAVRRELSTLNIPLVAEDIGGSHARSMEAHLDTGLVVVRSYNHGIKEL